MPEVKPRQFDQRRIMFRNFAGRAGQFNAEGDRNFCLLLTEEEALEMEAEGWNIKNLRAREVGDPDLPYIQVNVKYKILPPRIVLVTSKGRTPLTEDMVEFVDWVDIEYVDIIIRPYEWSMRGNSGVKAYVKTMFIKVDEDPLERRYAHLPEVGASQQMAIDAGDQNTIDYEGPIHTYAHEELGE